MTQQLQQDATGSPPVIGVVVVSHCLLAREMLRAAELILGPLEAARAVSIDPRQPIEQAVAALELAVREVDNGRGVLILTDLFGGTPANLSMPLIGPRVEVLCGANLPMLIKFAGCRGTHSLADAAVLLQEYGRRHISLASQFLPRTGGRAQR